MEVQDQEMEEEDTEEDTDPALPLGMVVLRILALRRIVVLLLLPILRTIMRRYVEEDDTE